ncbi:beta-ketoacyl-[acyl-carrier-protein] synthase family protein [Atlantibacter hermannii]|uniref:beta-ketoacyl-[acyl-carrier-protein] synthase family protein n=1 Tax=Atlantibacter hermannii TaxID=565 RepID=UPI0028AD1D2F|nr:beta-ketoacyl-[acyl-carrier-protein] synthase family protein [Atlantibacter hermannii]
MEKANFPRRVAVTGYGAITPLGMSASESWASIMDYRPGYAFHPTSSQEIGAHVFGLVDKEPDLRALPSAIRRRLPRFARMVMGAANEAVTMAFHGQSPLRWHSALKSGVVIGTGWAGQDESYRYYDEFLEAGMGNVFSCFHAMPSVATAACSINWGLRGYQNTPVAACATGSIAIGDAFEAIRCGRTTMMLAGAGESLRSTAAIWNIDVLGALTGETEDLAKACCPFSLDRNGFVLSEGAAVVCLEEYEVAVARGATILGEIKGYGNFSDAYDFTAPAPDCEARVHSITQALRQAGMRGQDIDYINAHGTSTPLNDLNETQAIKLALGEQAYKIPVSSTKSWSGHLIAAAGSFETIVCLQAIQHQIMPATAHLTHPDPECDLDYIPGTHRQGQVKNTLNLSFGFGGANAALVIGQVQ